MPVSDMKVSDNFQVKEFFTDGIPESVKNLSVNDRNRIGADKYPKDPYLFRIFLLCREILQPVRERWGSGIRITSSVRTAKTYQRFADQGISYASPTRSDHADHTLNPWSTGAADLVPTNGDVDGLMDLMAEMHDSGMNVGQIIFERNISGAEWIHVSNSQDTFFRIAGDTMRSIRLRHSPGVFQMVSKDGKTRTDKWR